MLVNAVFYTFPPDRADEVAGMLAELQAASRAEPGCVSYEAARSQDDPAVFMLHEVWRDQAALDHHYASEHFQRLGINGLRQIAVSRVAHKGAPL